MKHAALVTNANNEITRERKVVEDLDTMQGRITANYGRNGFFWSTATYHMWNMIEQLAWRTESRIELHQLRLCEYHDQA